MSIAISSNFDCGNIEIVDAGNPQAIRLNIRREQTGELQDYIWFYFALTGAKGQRCNFSIENASGNRWAPQAWKDYRIVASYDRSEWFRIPIEYDGKAVSWQGDCDGRFAVSGVPNLCPLAPGCRNPQSIAAETGVRDRLP